MARAAGGGGAAGAGAVLARESGVWEGDFLLALEIAGRSYQSPILIVRCPDGRRLRIAERGDADCQRTPCLEFEAK